MKIKIALAFSFLATLIVFEAIGASGDKIKVMDDHSKWVAQCLKDFQALKPGMTRGEIERDFQTDGGLRGVSPVRFAHPSCPYFKIDVAFDFKRNPDDQNRALAGKDDRSTTISKPYIEAPHLD